MTRDLVLLAAAWIAWGALHSLLVGRGARTFAARRLGVPASAYRLLYNAVALVTAGAVYLVGRTLDGPVVFTWWGMAQWVSPLLLVVAAAYFLAGARAYDLRAFLGFGEAHASADGAAGIGASGSMRRDGVLGVVRHPWYAGAFFVLWAIPRTAADLVTAIVLTAYVVAGTHLEEARLRREFGEPYRAYQREVSMYFPFRWIRRRAEGDSARRRSPHR